MDEPQTSPFDPNDRVVFKSGDFYWSDDTGWGSKKDATPKTWEQACSIHNCPCGFWEGVESLDRGEAL